MNPSGSSGKRKRVRMIVLIVLGLGLIGVGVGLQQYFKPHKDHATTSPDEVLTAEALITAFSSDDAAATARFVSGDKTVEVTGIVREVSEGDEGRTVTLSSENIEGSVACTIVKEGQGDAVSVGDHVAVRGQCAGMQGLIEPQVIMIRCVVRKAGHER